MTSGIRIRDGVVSGLLKLAKKGVSPREINCQRNGREGHTDAA
jgi:hypothetical protein